MKRVNIDQWHDRTKEPVIIWTYIGCWELLPVAVDDSHECDLYTEFARAYYAARAYQTFEEVAENASWYGLTPKQIEDLYAQGDGSAEQKGLPREYYAEGCSKDGSDAIIYIDEETEYNTHRESLADAAEHLYPENVAEIYREILAARTEYC